MGNLYLLSKCMRKKYLNKSEHFVLYNGGRVVFRRNDFHKDTINEVTSCYKGMETITTILDACLKHLHKKKKKNQKMQIHETLFFHWRNNVTFQRNVTASIITVLLPLCVPKILKGNIYR